VPLPQETNLKIVALSDTHGQYEKSIVPECNILIHAGDATNWGSEEEIRKFARWFAAQPAEHKIFVPGNHELFFYRGLPASELWFTEECPEGILLIDSGVCIDGINIWGSPWTPKFGDWGFMRNRLSDIKYYWDAIPDETDILITHGPPLYILDELFMPYGRKRGQVGCEMLWDRVNALPNLKYHIFGHIHDQYGMKSNGRTQFFNVAACANMNVFKNQPMVIEV